MELATFHLCNSGFEIFLCCTFATFCSVLTVTTYTNTQTYTASLPAVPASGLNKYNHRHLWLVGGKNTWSSVVSNWSWRSSMNCLIFFLFSKIMGQKAPTEYSFWVRGLMHSFAYFNFFSNPNKWGKRGILILHSVWKVEPFLFVYCLFFSKWFP